MVVGALVASLGACAPEAAEEPKLPTIGPAPDRPICGWETLEADTPRLELSASNPSPKAGSGDRVVAVLAAGDVPLSALNAALTPATNLVRLKVAIDGRWLLPLTYQRPRLPPTTPPEETVVSVVGHQRVTRRKSAPAVRLADLRLDGERLTLFVENETPGGSELAVVELAERLMQQQPPVEVFTLSATPSTPWRSYLATVQAAACHGLKPGDEPHEVVAVPPPAGSDAR